MRAPFAADSADELLKRRLLSGTGARVGRFVVQRHLDEGGMGLIFSAYDEELDRPVALKILRSEQGVGALGRARLVREAQALARLSHPNVVTVYEVGEWSGHVYVAMELINGHTLRDWLRLRSWGWREVVDMLTQAGRGLAAAHRAGIIHRDFKPSNVLIGADGRVRVLDFGLAFAPRSPLSLTPAGSEGAEIRESEESSEELLDTAMSTKSLLNKALTVAGAISGTPPYMAPEQLVGRGLDGRADQYAFCLTLFEGLYGKRLFRGSTLQERVAELARDQALSLPNKPKVPSHVRKVMLRGLREKPDERYPTMEELLVALSDDPIRRRRWLLGGSLAGVLLLSGGYGLARQEAAMNDSCRELGGELNEAWSAQRRDVAAALTGTGKGYASAAWERLEPRLAEYASAWGDKRVEACYAHQSGVHSAALYGRALGCLRQRRAAFQALLSALANADADVLAQAIQATDNLPRLDRCGDIEALAATVPPPEDPSVAAELEDLHSTLATARIEHQLRHPASGLALSSQVLSRAEELDYLPLKAEAMALHGDLEVLNGDYRRAERTLSEAMWLADELRDDDSLAQIMSSLVRCIGKELGELERAMTLRRHSEAVIERLGSKTYGTALLLSSFGDVESRKGDGEGGIELSRRALDIVEELYDPDDRRVAGMIQGLGFAYFTHGRYAEAEELFNRALALEEEHLGREHPALADLLNNLGSVRGWQGDIDGTLPYFMRALRIKEAVLGSEHPDIGGLLSNIGTTYAAQGNFDDARAYLERSLAIDERARGLEHPIFALKLRNLGNVYKNLGDYPTAKRHLERSLEIAKAKLDPDAVMTIETLIDLGSLIYAQGDRAAALRHLHEAHERRQRKPEGGPPDVLPDIRNRLAVIYLDSTSKRERAEGRAYAEKALADYRELDNERFAEAIKDLEKLLEVPPAKKKKKKKKRGQE